jgi:hypothetical protein
VYADGLVVLQASDLILHMQLAAFEFYDRRVVDRRVRHGVSEFGLERLVLSFQFRKMRLDGHLGSLLCEIPDLNILTEETRQVDGLLLCDASNPRNPHQSETSSRLDAASLTRDTVGVSAPPGGRRRVELLQPMTKEEERELRDQLARLLQEHRDLDAAIGALESSPGSDILQVQRLKKRKLHLKDRMTFIEDQLTPDIIA